MFQVYGRVIQLYIYISIYSFPDSFLLQVYFTLYFILFLNESCSVYLRIALVFSFSHFFFLFCCTGSVWGFLGQGLNLCHTAATRIIVVRMQEPQPTRPPENSIYFISLRIYSFDALKLLSPILLIL